MDHDSISMYATPAVSVLVCLTSYDADRWNPDSDPIWVAILLPIYSVMHTVTLIMETPLPDQGMAVGVGESEG